LHINSAIVWRSRSICIGVRWAPVIGFRLLGIPVF
jgi:hypothetical protein